MKKRSLHTTMFFVLLTTTTLFAQQPNTPKVGHKWELGLVYTPEFTNIIRTSIERNNGNGYYYGSQAIGFEGRLWKYGYTTGVFARHIFQEHWCFGMGLSYSNKGYKQTIDIGSGWFSSTPADIKTFYYFEKYLEVPLEIARKWGQEKLKYSISLGLVSGYIISYGIKSDDYNEIYTSRSKALDNIIIGSQLKFGIGYQIHEHWLASISPSVYYSLGQPFNKYVNTIHNLSIGLALSTSYCF